MADPNEAAALAEENVLNLNPDQGFSGSDSGWGGFFDIPPLSDEQKAAILEAERRAIEAASAGEPFRG